MKVECCVCLTDLPDQCKTPSYTSVLGHEQMLEHSNVRLFM